MTTVNVYPNSTGIITEDACTFRGVVLDRMDCTGPRGGKETLWRAATKRHYQMASWSTTKADAIR
jgi:hypothetical protein